MEFNSLFHSCLKLKKQTTDNSFVLASLIYVKFLPLSVSLTHICTLIILYIHNVWFQVFQLVSVGFSSVLCLVFLFFFFFILIFIDVSHMYCMFRH
ncbi:hypothetical protein LOK49_LG10G00892 [Camellia lanceoleosa]|uniref:Uncharacterized protein n=1 Tax=Camellia lanceoleosa TaxID=1840588 RepID=A0ACC0GEK9_9ERIC|nr:hypothetical protein LOK49_LG10G00892 [Camellia lanceoleosa]